MPNKKDTISDTDTILLTEKEDEEITLNENKKKTYDEDEHQKKSIAKGEPHPHPKTSTADSTIIPLSKTAEEYRKAGIEYPRIQQDVERESFERQTQGKWTRQVVSITWYKDNNEKEYLNWSERRQGKSGMGRVLDKRFDSVASYIIPIPEQKVVYNAEADENQLINTGTEKDRITVPGIPYSREALDKLLEDASKEGCEFIISQQGYRPYNVSKKEMTKSGNFDGMYNKVANIKAE